MPKVNLPIPLGFYSHQSRPFSAQRCINWIPTVARTTALNQAALIQRPGIKSFADTALGSCRGAWVMAGVPYFVSGTSLVSVDSAGVVTTIGTIAGANRVSMADNGTLLVIVVPGGNGYVYDGATLTQITDPDYQVSDTVVFYRGYFAFTTSNGKQLFVSNLNQPTVFDALDFGSAEGDPDRIVTQILDHDELSILGERTTEVFRLVGGADFPLQIIPGAYTEKGCSGIHGVVKFDNTYLYIGGGVNEQAAIWRQTSSAQATKISTDAIDNAIQKFTKAEIAGAFTMTYSEKGQIFALFSFNSTVIAGKTFVFNGTASALSGQPVWFELQSGVDDGSWRVNAIVKAYGKLLCGDSVNGRIGYLDGDTYTDHGEAIFRQATTSPFIQDGLPIFSGEIEAIFESGTGLTIGQGSDPTVRMDFSDNGARSFSSEFSRSIGKIGEYEHRAMWRRQGRFPVSRTIRFTITDPVLANLLMITATPEIGVQ
jgi:hypothetical protein